ncbi:pheromone A receptor-domain-containing protein [Daldinia sp. FL1419]|nr:pheromone A receptor-domain-containing protein [Daldinia sp. FL1419]
MAFSMKVVLAIAFVGFGIAAAFDEHGLTHDDAKYSLNVGLQVNLVLRVLFATIGTGLCWPPFKALWRHGDIPGVSLIATVSIMNLFTVMNSLIWASDNWDNWWSGVGFCDVQVYLAMPLKTIYAATIFSVVYELSKKFDVRRAMELNSQQCKWRVVKQVLIIYTAPAIQLISMYFVASHRYNVGALVGCIPRYDNDWLKVVIFDVPNPIYVTSSIPFAIYAYIRFKRYANDSQIAIESNNLTAARHVRLRRRLYNVTASVMLVYTPVSFILLAQNIQKAVQAPPKPYDFGAIHGPGNAYLWDLVTFVPSWDLDWLVMNQPWFAILTTVVIVAFFGTSEECWPVYRGCMLWLGLGRCIPNLRQQNVPNSPNRPNHDHPDDHPGELPRDGIELVDMDREVPVAA